MSIAIFSGTAHPALAQAVCTYLQLPLGDAKINQFSDGEIACEILQSVRGTDAFIIQPTCAPTNDNLMQVLLLADALKRASARRITAVLPYFGYARQDRRIHSARVPISAKVVANMLTCAGIDRVLTIDLHAEQIQGFFDTAIDNLYATPYLLGDLKAQNYDNLKIVSPDTGGVVRARALAKMFNTEEIAIIDKRRPHANQAQVMNIIGDVVAHDCVIIDDMADTAGTLCKAAAALKEAGARRVVAYVTHPVLSGNAIDNINASVLDEIVVTDTIPLQDNAKSCQKVRVVSIAVMIAQSIQRIHHEQSLSELFK